MQKKTIGQVEVKYIDGISTEVQQLAEKLQRCFASRSIFKNNMLGTLDPDEVCTTAELEEKLNTDYVEWIELNSVIGTIAYGQGDYIIQANIADVVVENAMLDNFTEEADKIRIALKAGAYLMYTDGVISGDVFKLRKDGLCGERVLIEAHEGRNVYSVIKMSRILRTDAESVE